MTQPPPPASDRPSPYPVTTASGAGLGRVAFVLAMVAAAIGVLQQIVGVFIPVIANQYQYSTVQIAAIFGSFTFLHAAISLAALVTGVLAAQRGGAPVRAGIAIGIGALGVIGGVVALAVVPVIGFAL